VRVSLELQPCGFSGTLHHARKARCSEWCPALRRKHERRLERLICWESLPDGA
jgi:hypothetical protein